MNYNQKAALVKRLFDYFNFLQNKKALLLLFFKVSESHSFLIPKSQSDRESKNARKYMEATKPPDRTLDRNIDLNRPEAVFGVPTRIHGPEISFGIANIGDIRVAVSQKNTILTVFLFFEQINQVR